MRISANRKVEIQQRIMCALFDVADANINKRTSAIAAKNREYYLAPYQHLIDILPIELLSKDTMYTVRIKHTAENVEENWVYYGDSIVNPRSGDNIYRNTFVATLDTRLQEEANILIKEILALRTEEKTMNAFLKQTFDKYNTDIQLRKVWPESLHKYLPAPTPKKPRVKKVPATPTSDPVIAIPAALNNRLVTNLLEGE